MASASCVILKSTAEDAVVLYCIFLELSCNTAQFKPSLEKKKRDREYQSVQVESGGQSKHNARLIVAPSFWISSKYNSRYTT